MRQVTRKGLLTAAAAGGMLAMSTGAAHADAEATGGSTKSPGVLSGNTVQAPVHVPVQVCGNTINVVGALNPAYGNQCVTDGSGHGGAPHEGGGHGGEGHGGGGHAGGGQHESDGGRDARDHGGAQARGVTRGSPGVASGNNVQVPIEVPVSACGNNVSAVGLGNAAMGNSCLQQSGGKGPAGHDGSPRPRGPQGGHSEQDGGSGASSTRREAPRPMEVELSTAQPVRTDAMAAEAASEVETTASGGGQLAQTGAGSSLFAAVPLGAGLVLGGVVLYRRRAAFAGRA